MASENADTFIGNKIISSDRAAVVTAFQRHANDRGSSEVQIALLTKKIETLAKHSSENPNDVHSRRGMMSGISTRKRLLSYLKGKNPESYKKVIATLGLRK